jgi:hypothetical protein
MNNSILQTKPTAGGPAPRRSKKTQVTVRAKLVSYPQTRSHAKAHRAEMALFRGLMFCFLTVSAYGVSSIAGQVAVERSRREESKALARTQTAMTMETSLRTQLNELTRPDTIEAWALQNHFVAPGLTSPKSVDTDNTSDVDSSADRNSTLVAVRD